MINVSGSNPESYFDVYLPYFILFLAFFMKNMFLSSGLNSDKGGKSMMSLKSNTATIAIASVCEIFGNIMLSKLTSGNALI